MLKKFDVKYKVSCVIILGLLFIFSYSDLYAQYYTNWEFDLSDMNDLEEFEKQVTDLKEKIDSIMENQNMNNEEKSKALDAYKEDVGEVNSRYGDKYHLSVDIVQKYNNASNATGDFWEQANNWFSGGDLKQSISDVTSGSAGKIIDEFSEMVNLIGTTVIVLVTIFLGIKFMYGSVESKASAKEGLLNLLVACIFFFGWSAIWNLLFNGNSLVLVENTLEGTIAKIFNTLTVVANFLAIGVVIYLGIKYIFAGAKGKSELKLKSSTFLIGVIMSFCAIGLLNYISSIINSLLASS